MRMRNMVYPKEVTVSILHGLKWEFRHRGPRAASVAKKFQDDIIAKTWGNHHWWTVPTSINGIEPGVEEKSTTIQQKTRQSYSPPRQCWATCRKADEKNVGDASLGCSTSPDVFARHCSLWLTLIPFDAELPVTTALQFFREHPRKWIDSRINSKDKPFFCRGIRFWPER